MEWNGLEWFDDGYYIMITSLVCWRDVFVLSFTFLVDVEYNTVFFIGWLALGNIIIMYYYLV
jgi:hypothetical protein